MRLRCPSIHAGLHSHSACPDCEHTVENHTLDGLCDTCDIINHLAPMQPRPVLCGDKREGFRCNLPHGHLMPHLCFSTEGRPLNSWGRPELDERTP